MNDSTAQQSPVLQEHDGIIVVRDDLMPGGTKARVLPILMNTGKREYVYASPVCGYAQVALAHVARAAGKKATVFCAKRAVRHRLTMEAERAGAQIVEVSPGYMSVARARAKDYCRAHGAHMLPFGLDVPEFLAGLADVARALPMKPKEVWSVAGSGVLTRALQMAWPDAAVYAVQVGAVPDAGRAKVLVAPEKFDQGAKAPPPFPSCTNYDAKAWRFVLANANKGAVFWNVAS